MRALVTGGAGFIGSHIVEELLRGGHSVRVLDNFSSGRRENLHLFRGDLEILEGDLRDPQAVKAAVRDVEFVFHLAAFVSVPQSMSDPETCFAINAGGTVTLLEAARQAEVRKVVLSSSTAVYGDTDRFPTDETTPLLPLSPYAVSKQVNELYARLYTRVFHLPVVALRYFNVYGPRQRPDSDYAAAIPIFIRRLVAGQPLTIYGDGKQSRDFIFVKDVVRANWLAAQSEAAGEAFNVCTGRETSLLDLMEELSEIAPHQPEVRFEAPRPGDIYRSAGSPEKAAAGLGFRAEVSLADGLAQTVEWMENK
ncbi:MAG TPA: SDR family oxidoreductase [Anaerolineales bacterium]|nr:SDR family oxidoreductase [Anaerolineales bacterium]